MNKLLLTGTLLLSLALAPFAQAEDVQVSFPLKNALENPKISSKLNHVKLFWGDQGHPAVKTDFGEFKTSKRTNAFMKAREEACQWALASALIQLQERAVAANGQRPAKRMHPTQALLGRTARHGASKDQRNRNGQCDRPQD